MSKPETKEPEAKQKPKKCGLIMPISAIDGCGESHWEQVRAIIKEALAELDLSVDLVSEADEVGVIQGRIIQNIYDNDIVICDVSCKNPNVMFELGMRLAFDKPAVVIKDELTSYSFDTSPVEHLTYPRGLHYHQIQDFKVKLRAKVVATLAAVNKPEHTSFLKHFGKFVVAGIDQKPVGKQEYLLAKLEELTREMGRLRLEQQEFSSAFIRPSQRNFPASSSLPSPEEFIMEFLKRSVTPFDIEAIKDPQSELFRRLHRDYMDKVVSRAVNPKGRHESFAEMDLLKAINRILP
jgi:hypothetical protein